jgi:nucleoside-diphosphate-sugar epimerase
MLIKVVLFSPNGYIGGVIKETILKENRIELYEITRGSDLGQYTRNYNVMIYSASVSSASAEKYVQDNIVTAITIVEFCKKHHIDRIIYLSSDSIYGELNTDMVHEKVIMVNPNIYGLSKCLAEKIIMESGIPYYILRLPGVVGRVWRKNFVYDLMTRIKNNETVELYNMDRRFNNILDVDDLTRFVILLCKCRHDVSEVFLLGNTENIVLGEMVFYIRELYHSTSQIRNVETNQKRYFLLDVAKAVEYGYLSSPITNIIDQLYQISQGRRAQ